MQTHEEPPIENWADFIDALHLFRTPWPYKTNAKLQARPLQDDPGLSPENQHPRSEGNAE